MSPLGIAACGSIAWLALHIALYFWMTGRYRRRAERQRRFRQRMLRYLKPVPWG